MHHLIYGVLDTRRDHSAGYCYIKQKRQGSQEYVDDWIPYEKPPVSPVEAHVFRAKQVRHGVNNKSLSCMLLACSATGGSEIVNGFYPSFGNR